MTSRGKLVIAVVVLVLIARTVVQQAPFVFIFDAIGFFALGTLCVVGVVVARPPAGRMPVRLAAIGVLLFCFAALRMYPAILLSEGRREFSPPFTQEYVATDSVRAGRASTPFHYTVFVTPAQVAKARALSLGLPIAALLLLAALMLLRSRRTAP